MVEVRADGHTSYDCDYPAMNARARGHIPGLDDPGPAVPGSALPAPLQVEHGTAVRLWQDILEQYRRGCAHGSDVPRHFIGSIVAVEREADPLHDFREFRVVDGQQRLTTLSVAIAALRDVAAQDDPDQFDRLGEKY